MDIKKYPSLKKGTRDKLSQTNRRLQKVGLTPNEFLDLNRSEQKKALNYKGLDKNFDGTIRNVKQLIIGVSKDDKLLRQKSIVNISTKFYVKIGFRRKKLSRMKAQLSKSMGLNIFYDIAKKVQKKYKLSKDASYRKTDSILKRALIDYGKLKRKEKNILSYFS